MQPRGSLAHFPLGPIELAARVRAAADQASEHFRQHIPQDVLIKAEIRHQLDQRAFLVL